MSVFKTYYADPEYKAKHLAYMKTKVPCKICGHMVQRSNMSHHAKTSKAHKNIHVIDFNKIEAKDIDDMISRLQAIRSDMENLNIETI